MDKLYGLECREFLFKIAHLRDEHHAEKIKTHTHPIGANYIIEGPRNTGDRSRERVMIEAAIRGITPSLPVSRVALTTVLPVLRELEAR